MISVPASAQINDPVEIIGLERLEEETVRAMLGLPSPYDETTLAQAMNRLVQSGLFESVQVDQSGEVIRITVAELPLLDRLYIEGNKAFTDEELLEIVSVQPRSVVNFGQIETARTTLLDFYVQQGFTDAETQIKTTSQSGNQMDVVFLIDEGPRLGVERIVFVGNMSVDSCKLRKVISTKQNGDVAFPSEWRGDQGQKGLLALGELAVRMGFMTGLISANPLDPASVENDRFLLETYYRRAGYLDVSVTSADVARNDAGTDHIVTFTLSEGDVYRFGDSSVVFETEDVTLNLGAYPNVRKGDVYDVGVIEETVDRLEAEIDEAGLSFVHVEPRVVANPIRKEVDVAFHLLPSPRVLVHRINIEGNTITLDRVIRRAFSFAEGDPFNQRQVEKSIQAIRNTGLFDSVDMDITPSDEGLTISVDVAESATGRIEFSPHYSTSTGLGTSLFLMENNFLGKGQSVEIGGRLATGGAYVRAKFTEPSFLDRDIPLVLGFEFTTGEAFDPFTALYGLQFTAWLGFVVIRIPIILLILLGSAYYCHVWRDDPTRVRVRYRQMISRAKLVFLIQGTVVASGLLSSAALVVASPVADSISYELCSTWS